MWRKLHNYMWQIIENKPDLLNLSEEEACEISYNEPNNRIYLDRSRHLIGELATRNKYEELFHDVYKSKKSSLDDFKYDYSSPKDDIYFK